MSDHTTIEIEKYPDCDICHKPALYDANLGMGWGNVCQVHFNQFGCTIGLGKGQKYIIVGGE